MTEAIACNSSSSVLIFLAPKFLDKWAAKCEEKDNTANIEEGDDFPTWLWLNVFLAASDILSLCQETDSSSALPGECKKSSAQFLAWEFGRLVGRICMICIHLSSFEANPLAITIHMLSHAIGFDADYFEEFDERDETGNVRNWLTPVLALLSEYEQGRNWEKARRNYIFMWQCSFTSQGMSLAEVAPENNLYWAMRIGFADKILESSNQLQPVQVPADALETISTRTGLEVMKIGYMMKDIPTQLQQIKQSLSGKEDVVNYLREKLGAVWDKLPSSVVDELRAAEQGYRSEFHTCQSTISFGRALESCFRCYFTDALVDYMREKDIVDMTLIMGEVNKSRPTRIGIGTWRPDVINPTKLSLRDWAGLFEILADPEQKEQTNSNMKAFLKQKWPKLNMADLRELIRPFKVFQDYRNKAAHPQPPRSHLEEKNELEQMRNLVLGSIKERSVIVQIFQLLSAKSSS
jgi:hypothetical protein